MKFLFSLIAFIGAFGCFSQNKTYQEDLTNFVNPERGFYQHTEVHSSNYNNLNSETLSAFRNEGISLILRVFYLEDFKEGVISSSYLENMNRDFQIARLSGVKVIVRFAYTKKSTSPFGDAPLEIVLNHIEQLKPVFFQNADVIALVQAGFIGAWGEWYYTDHFSNQLGFPNEEDWIKRRQVVDALLKALPSKRVVQLRTPLIKTSIIEDETALSEINAFTNQPVARLAHHNDCFLASASDVGTYTGNIVQEKAYLEEETKYLPMGGETCGVSEPYSLCENALLEMERFHWSYLNIGYHPSVLSGWMTNGCFTDVQKKLGYRYRLLNTTADVLGKPGGEYSVELTITNDGWANIYNKRDVFIVIKNQQSGTEYNFKTDLDPRLWSLDDQVNSSFTIGVPENIEEGDYSVFINMPDNDISILKDPKYSIRLANLDVWDEILGYNDLGITLNIAKSNAVPNYVGSNFFRSDVIGSVTSSNVVVDGLASDWFNLPSNLSSSENNFGKSLKLYNDSDSLYLLIEGNNLNSSYQFFIDLDKSEATGYHAWQWLNNGAELMVENGVLYTYSGINNEWGWDMLAIINDQKNNAVIELAISLNEIGSNSSFSFAFVNDPNGIVEPNYLPSQGTDFYLYNQYLTLSKALFLGAEIDRTLLYWPKVEEHFTRVVEKSTNGEDFELIASFPGNLEYYLDYDVALENVYTYRYFLINNSNVSTYSENISTSLTSERGDFYNIQTDGEEGDWFGIPPLTTQTFGLEAYTIRSFFGSEKAHFILSGEGINQYAIYLNTDNNSSTGGLISTDGEGGFDYLLSNDSLYENVQSEWVFTGQKTVSSRLSLWELSIPLDLLSNLKDNRVIKISAKLKINSSILFLPDENQSAINQRTLPATVPTNVEVRKSTADPESRLIVSWAFCDNCDGYILQRSIDGEIFEQVSRMTFLVNSFSDTELLNQTLYYYRILSYNIVGPSKYSTVVSQTTGIDVVLSTYMSIEESINMYPNPANDIVNIKTHNNNELLDISFFNLSGQKVMQRKFTLNDDSDKKKNVFRISIDALAPGLYIAFLKTNDGLISTKFIKQ